MLNKYTRLVLGSLFGLTLCAQENLVQNPNFNRLKPWQDWRGRYDAGVSHTADGSGSWCFDYPDSSKPGHIFQKIIINQKSAAPLLVSAWCKAEIPGSWGKDQLNFALRTCVVFNDGSKTWKYNRAYTAGIKEWQKQEMIIDTGKPVKELLLYGRFANHKGKVWFDDFTVRALGQKEFAPCKVEKVELPGKCEGIKISNQFLSLVFEPGRGGRCTEFKLLHNSLLPGAEGNFPFFGGDRMLRFNYRSTLAFPFKGEVLSASDDMVRLALTKEDLPGEPYLKFTRIYTLKRNSGNLQIDTVWHNRSESMAERVLSPHFRSSPFFRGQKSVYFIPEERGTEIYSAESGGDTFLPKVTGNFAGVSNGRGEGLAFEFDAAALEQLYMWRGGMDQSTLELFYIPSKIAPGKELTRRSYCFPFSGIERLDGAANGIAVQIEREKIKLYSSSELAPELEVSAIYGKDEKTLLKKLLLLPLGQLLEIPLPQADSKGLCALKVTLKNQDRLIFSALRPLAPQFRLSTPPKIEKAENTELSHTISEAVKTPAVPWAKNWHKGKTKVLFLIDSTHGREIAELAQRMELEHHTLWLSMDEGTMKWGRNAMFGSYTFDDANRELSRLLKSEKFDAIVITCGIFGKISAPNANTITQAVKGGTGLLLVNPRNTGKFSALFPASGNGRMVPFARWRQLREHQILSGTLTEQLLPGEATPFPVRNAERLLVSENNIPLLQLFTAGKGKCALFGAGSGGGMLPFLPRQYQLPDYDFHELQFVPLIKALLYISNKLPQTAAGVKVTGSTLVFHGGDTIEVRAINLTSGAEKTLHGKAGSPITVPLAPGSNIFHCIIRKNGKCVWFGSTASVTAPTGKIEKIILEKDFFQKGEKITGQVKYTGTAQKIILSLIDSFGRVIVRGEGESFALPLEENSSRRMYVKAELFHKGVLQSSEKIPVKVKIDQPMAAYEIIGTSDNGDKKLHRAFDTRRWQLFRKIFGIRVVRHWSAPAYRQVLFEEQLRHGYAGDFPMITGQRLKNFFKDFSEPYARTKDKKYLQRTPCMHDEAHFKKTVADMKERFSRLKGFSPVSYDFDDESSLSKWGNPYDFCYGPLTMKAFRQELKKRYVTLDKLNASWGTAFADWEKVLPMTTEEIRTFAAKSKNYAAWAEFREFMDAAYSAWHSAIAAEARKAGIKVPLDISGTSKGNAFNGFNWYRWSKFIDQASLYHGADEEELMRSFAKSGFRATPWFGYGQFDSSHEYRLWCDALLFRQGGASYYSSWSMLRPEYTLDEAPKKFERATRDLRQGCGELLKLSKPVQPDVLIHFSQPSVYAFSAEERLPEFVGSRSGWIRLLTDCGLSFDFIAYAEIEEGKLQNHPCKTLILPSSVALSPKEAAEISRFIRRGGRVIASGTPGAMNEKSTLLARPLLADAPVIKVDDPGNYPFSPREKVHRAKISTHLPSPGTAFSGDMSRTRLFAYHLGEKGKLYGILREADAQGKGKITLKSADSRFWYDVRRSRLLGRGRELPLEIVPAKAVMIASLKTQLPRPLLSLKQSERKIFWQISLPKCSETTVFNVEVLTPAGEVYELYSLLAPAPGGKAQGCFRPALNDPKGEWRVRCTDRISGLKTEKSFTLK